MVKDKVEGGLVILRKGDFTGKINLCKERRLYRISVNI